jgi:hypothetical protein
LIPAGYLLILFGSWSGNITVLLIGASLAGLACYGFTYLGGMALFAKAAGPKNAKAISGYYLFCYLGFSAPIIVVGFISDLVGLFATLIYFGIGIVISNGILLTLLQINIGKKI